MARRSVISENIEETANLAIDLARELSLGDIVCFFGDLGAGKTTLIKTLVSKLTNTPLHDITSPTFNYCQTYGNVHHFDLYRLQTSRQFFELGFDEFLGHGAICLIEWSERIQDVIPPHAWKITIDVIGNNKRKITYETPSFSTRNI